MNRSPDEHPALVHPLLAAARGLAAEVEQHAAETERLGHLPATLHSRLRDSGVFGAMVASSCGGHEADLATVMASVEELARADGAVGWLAFIGTSSGVMSGWLDDTTCKKVFGAPRVGLVPFVGEPTGEARRAEGGHLVRGHWSFVSGCRDADWVILTCRVTTADGSATDDEAFVFVPAHTVAVSDAWDVAGMRGTGSHEIDLPETFVPHQQTILRTMRTTRVGPLYRFGRAVIPQVMAAVPLGIAQGAIQGLVELASLPPRPGSTMLRDRHPVQVEVGRASALLASARAYLFDTVEEAWSTVVRGDELDLRSRAQLRLSASHAATTAADVVRMMWNAGGTRSIYRSGPLERRFRDVHVATQNVTINSVYYGVVGKILLGLGQPDRWP